MSTPAAAAKKTAGHVPAPAADNVVLFPTLREIPTCSMNLGLKGLAEYDRLARVFLNAGLLTEMKVRHIEAVALCHHTTDQYITNGKMVPVSVITQLNLALRNLNLEEADQPAVPGQQARTNRFARAGFAARNRAPSR